MNKGWIKIHRKVLDNPVVCKDADHFAVWIYLLLEASHDQYDKLFGGNRITINPGQLITGRKIISQKLDINQSKVQRILKRFESEQQIEQQTSNVSRLISIINWSEYQKSEQRIEQQVNNERTTSEQRVNTLQEYKELKNVKNNNIYGVLTNPGLVDDSVVKTNTVFYELKNNINNLYRRKETTKWANKETNKLKEISKRQDAMQEFNQIKELYESGYKYRRKDIITLLNNWTGELDRAVGKKPMPKKYGI